MEDAAVVAAAAFGSASFEFVDFLDVIWPFFIRLFVSRGKLRPRTACSAVAVAVAIAAACLLMLVLFACCR